MSEFVVKVPAVLKKDVSRIQREVESMICAEEKAALLSSFLDEAMKGAKQLSDEELVNMSRKAKKGRIEKLKHAGLV